VYFVPAGGGEGVTVGSLFAGIGGFDLGFERAGFEVKWQVEIDPFCRAVLAKHWPDVRRYEDVRTVGAELERVDVLCGGFPCQDVSSAGPRIGISGERSGLWGEFHRVICELRPRYVVVENTEGLLARGLDRVLGDLAGSGYDAEWACIQAADLGAPHERERLFLVAYPDAVNGQARVGMRDAKARTVFAGNYPQRLALWLASAGLAPRVDDGLPTPLDRRLRTEVVGNSIVPQIAEWIARRILEAEAVKV
jgi:DNA (cytosine-5)-methyltransferase 1